MRNSVKPWIFALLSQEGMCQQIAMLICIPAEKGGADGYKRMTTMCLLISRAILKGVLMIYRDNMGKTFLTWCSTCMSYSIYKYEIFQWYHCGQHKNGRNWVMHWGNTQPDIQDVISEPNWWSDPLLLTSALIDWAKQEFKYYFKKNCQ